MKRLKEEEHLPLVSVMTNLEVEKSLSKPDEQHPHKHQYSSNNVTDGSNIYRNGMEILSQINVQLNYSHLHACDHNDHDATNIA